MHLPLIVSLALLCHCGAHSACFIVYDMQGHRLYRSLEPPVDLSQPLSQTVPLRFGPGAVMLSTPHEHDCGPLLPERAPQARPGLPPAQPAQPPPVSLGWQAYPVTDAPTDSGPERAAPERSPPGTTVHTGPRGGRYTLTPSGKKRYIRNK